VLLADLKLKVAKGGQEWCFLFVIPVTQEAEIMRIMVQVQPERKEEQ
jgi:hypothetical protein